MPEQIWSQELYIKAHEFAARAHQGQELEGLGLPYIVHPVNVCMEVIAALEAEPDNDGNLAIQCALLHDVIEDTEMNYQIIEENFGLPVAQGVLALSKDKNLPKDNQLKDSLKRIKLQPREIHMVKLADRITNLLPPPVSWSDEKINGYLEDAVDIFYDLGNSSDFLAARLKGKIENYRQYLIK